MIKIKVKTGDTVRVTTGEDKGKEGKIVKILKDKNKAIVEGVNMVSKHTKPSAQNPQGGISKFEAPIHISNIMLVENGNTVKVGYKIEGDKKVRFSKKSKEII
ncbi:50S ribosomal protein L24 [Aureibaculum sp. 2210JD6-5]|uniref:50S ribosomal protein L24 n=1 Tax=Aureibaculum sp. 2210JD6-5 TaxID=3103957 RepID=UPI002AACBCC8|nr:50S ribosomal protein L24 [Aureibaculum sp. 2210JD6-5]MDY7394388.1 50S ribosomal protein L24 [Aureibaculum sp. 2210JD6-5]